LLDGLFSNQKFPIWIFLEVLGMENVGISMTIWNILRPWYILWQFGIVCGNLVIFPVLVWQYLATLIRT
jgi:hypothetical protein